MMNSTDSQDMESLTETVSVHITNLLETNTVDQELETSEHFAFI